jgi:succinyl-CoA synthetase alpha subunit
MGHAGAIISSGEGTADGKIEAMKDAGVYMSDTPANIANTLIEALKENELWRSEYED